MKHPPYHLRPNKAADRFVFIEAIRRLEKLSDVALGDYTYHGLGGPYLEDFRLLYEFCPEIDLVSIEMDEDTYKRQIFHSTSSTLQLIRDDVTSYIARYNPGDMKSIFWLDYTRLEYSCFENFKALLGMVAECSMVKVTLRSEPKDYWGHQSVEVRRKKADRFRAQFERVMANPSTNPPRKAQAFASLLQEMLQIAAEQALPPAATTLRFFPVSSFYYSDKTWMFTLTGIVSQSSARNEMERAYGDWEFFNLTWNQPRLIDVPDLSTKERLHLQRLLPSSVQTGRTLREALGYLIHDDISKTEAALEQYAAFHRYSPYVLRGVP